MNPTFKVIAFLFWIIPFSLTAQKAEILKVITDQAKAWNNGDLKGFMDGYLQDDSLRFISKNGVTYGWKPVLENYQKSYPTKEKMGFLEFDAITINLLSDNDAFVTGRWKVSADKVQGGYFSLLFNKRNGKWVIVCDHTS